MRSPDRPPPRRQRLRTLAKEVAADVLTFDVLAERCIRTTQARKRSWAIDECHLKIILLCHRFAIHP
jgi:hypothetical protein